MDNAAKDNKNAFMFAYLALLVELNWFQEVYVHFLPPGHTHSNLDQKYSVISQALKNKDVFSLDHLIQEVGGLFGDMGAYTQQEVVTSIGDFSSVLKDNVHQLYGHGTSTVKGVNRRLHAFKITRHTDGRAGELPDLIASSLIGMHYPPLCEREHGQYLYTMQCLYNILGHITILPYNKNKPSLAYIPLPHIYQYKLIYHIVLI